MRGALRTLRRSKHKPSKLAPEWSPDQLQTKGKPQAPGNAKIWVTGNDDSAHLTWFDDAGVHNLPLTTNHLTNAQLPAIAFPDAELMAEPAASHLAEQLFHRPARVITPEKRLRHAAQSEWNLGQFEFAWRNPFFIRIAKRWSIFWSAPEWRASRLALLIVVIVHILGINAFAWRSMKQLEQQRLSIRDILVSTFPQVSVVVDPPVQMERELNVLRQASGSLSARDLETLLAALGTSAESTLSEGAPTSIDFTPGELRVTGLKSGTPSDAALNSGLQQLGYTSRIDGNAIVISVQGPR
jgi:general secretion pathway protein L